MVKFSKNREFIKYAWSFGNLSIDILSSASALTTASGFQKFYLCLLNFFFEKADLFPNSSMFFLVLSYLSKSAVLRKILVTINHGVVKTLLKMSLTNFIEVHKDGSLFLIFLDKVHKTILFLIEGDLTFINLKIIIIRY